MVIKAKPGYHQAVAARAYDLPGAIMVETTYDLRAELDRSMAMNYIFIGILMTFAGALTVAIVYNTINSNVQERRAEIASLRALGVTMREITRMGAVGTRLPLWVSVGVRRGLPGRGPHGALADRDFSIDFYISPRTFIVSIVFTLVLVCLPDPRRCAASLDEPRADERGCTGSSRVLPLEVRNRHRVPPASIDSQAMIVAAAEFAPSKASTSVGVSSMMLCRKCAISGWKGWPLYSTRRSSIVGSA